jgi:hypothetical protein
MEKFLATENSHPLNIKNREDVSYIALPHASNT